MRGWNQPLIWSIIVLKRNKWMNWLKIKEVEKLLKNCCVTKQWTLHENLTHDAGRSGVLHNYLVQLLQGVGQGVLKSMLPQPLTLKLIWPRVVLYSVKKPPPPHNILFLPCGFSKNGSLFVNFRLIVEVTELVNCDLKWGGNQDVFYQIK